MTLEDVLQELLSCLGSEGDCIIDWQQVRHWPDGAIDTFIKAGWLKFTASANTVECGGCDEYCIKPVHVLPGLNGKSATAFVACDEREDMGRVKIPLAYLQQWQFTVAQLAKWVAVQLGIKGKPELDKITGVYKLGNVQGKKRLGLVELDFAGAVSLKISGYALLLSEAVIVEGDHIGIDRLAVLDMVDLLPAAEKDKYQPSIARREARKLDTQAMYESWQKAYRKFKRDNPSMKDTEIARKIAKIKIAQGRDTETIRKNMIK